MTALVGGHPLGREAAELRENVQQYKEESAQEVMEVRLLRFVSSAFCAVPSVVVVLVITSCRGDWCGASRCTSGAQRRRRRRQGEVRMRR
jgi:hypothetical protein